METARSMIFPRGILRGGGLRRTLAPVLVLAACTVTETGPGASGVVIPRSGHAAADSKPGTEPASERPSEAEFRERLTSVRRALRDQDYDRALAALDEFKRLKPPLVLAKEADVLRVEVKQHLLQSTYVDAFVLSDRDRVALGDPLTGELILVNLSREPLVIPARSAGPSAGSVSSSTVHVEVAYCEHGLDGTIVRERVTWNLEVGEDLKLAPGARRSWPLNLDTLQFSPRSLHYRTYTVEAMLYPAEIRIGAESFPGNLRFRARTWAVFPRNYEHLEGAPLSRLKEAISKESSVHVPLAAALAQDADRPAVLRVLLDSLAKPEAGPPGGATRLACCVALRILTGEELPAEPAQWLAWDREVRRKRE